MRERLGYCSHNLVLGRITPAYAGKTTSTWRTVLDSRDHPRVCGKDLRKRVERCKNKGSPPRMRERQQMSFGSLPSARITPAYAGKTTNVIWVFAFCEDHPRVCGKDNNLDANFTRFEGSPPRMRERPSRFVPSIVAPGITPAYAGKTLSSLLTMTRHGDHPRVCGKD